MRTLSAWQAFFDISAKKYHPDQKEVANAATLFFSCVRDMRWRFVNYRGGIG
jgi:hypothetical protein